MVIPSIIQSYVLYWYYTYLIHSGMDRTETIIHQHLYWTGIRDAFWKEVINCDSNEILEWIYQVLGILVRNFNIKEWYFDEDKPWSGVLAVS